LSSKTHARSASALVLIRSRRAWFAQSGGTKADDAVPGRAIRRGVVGSRAVRRAHIHLMGVPVCVSAVLSEMVAESTVLMSSPVRTQFSSTSEWCEPGRHRVSNGAMRMNALPQRDGCNSQRRTVDRRCFAIAESVKLHSTRCPVEAGLAEALCHLSAVVEVGRARDPGFRRGSRDGSMLVCWIILKNRGRDTTDTQGYWRVLFAPS
jgi:hypothetical protein